ncbi:MAG: hypothetical protein ABUL62_34745 [Myxococcales bacterium]
MRWLAVLDPPPRAAGLGAASGVEGPGARSREAASSALGTSAEQEVKS